MGKLQEVSIPRATSFSQYSFMAISRLDNLDGVKLALTAGMVYSGLSVILKMLGSPKVSSFHVIGLPSLGGAKVIYQWVSTIKML